MISVSTPEICDSRRRKASASLEHFLVRGGLNGAALFQTPKGVCLIGAFGRMEERLLLPRIPDAERRLPHWSGRGGRAQFGWRGLFQTPKGVCLIGAVNPAHLFAASHAAFQTPKGVCLIGASLSISSSRSTPHSRRRKASASLERLSPRSAAISCSDSRRRKASASLERQDAEHRDRRAVRIPDAERRLPHWSTTCPAAFGFAKPYSRRRKASASLERL